MKVKKYVANSMPEAMQRIRAELGDEAVILNSKEVETGGFLGFFTKKKLEVIVAIDEEKTRRATKRERKQPIETEKSPPVLKELSELKQLVHKINERIDETDLQQKEYPQPFQQVDDLLKKEGVSNSLRMKLMKQLLKKWTETEEVTNIDQLYIELEKMLQDELKSLPFGGINFDKKIVAIVGPTGVGKTTTIAKIAADSVLKKQKKVALITTDTYRIAAVEQLKTYAKILNIPIEVAYSVDDFKRAVDQFQQCDLIIVDSAGRNFRNPLYVNELSKVIDFKEEVKTFLTLSLASKYEDMKEIVNQFSLLPIDQVILTKEDETSSHGAMINIPLELKKGIAYITNGQNVPDDFVEASIPYIIHAVIGERSNE